MPSPATKRIAELLYKSKEGKLTPEENIELSSWINSSEANKAMYNNFINGEYFIAFDILNRVDKKDIKTYSKRNFSLLIKKKEAMIAAILLTIIIGIPIARHLLRNKAVDSPQIEHTFMTSNESGIILTLANGKNVNIDTLEEGITQNNALIKLTGSGLSYFSTHNPIHKEFNRLTTLYGKQSFIRLPDGSKVWLNACSSISYPTAFDDKARKVQLTGEAFFQISTITDSTLPGCKVPFIVELENDKQVIVKGTEFNLSAYNDANVKATLLEGVIELHSDNDKKLLVPGEQAIIGSSGDITVAHPSDPNESLSWKNGYFNFNDASIEVVMKEISRWYHVSVEYKQYISSHFTLTVYRDITLSNLLDLLEMNSSVQFEVSGSKVFVSKQ